jgi:arylsulfatase A
MISISSLRTVLTDVRRRLLYGSAAHGIWLLAVAFTFVPCIAAKGQDAKRRPNIVFIIADDLGYGDLGCYGQQKIKTPNIDRLASRGIRFTNFYCGSPVCAPSRSVLMTGLHSGHGPIRDNKELKPEGQQPLPTGTITLARLLKNAGYATGLIGKWGLGMFGSSGDPLANGFDFFYGYNCQRHAHNFYPTYLYKNDQCVPLDGNTDGVTGKTYSHDLLEKEALAFIRSHRKEPFFLYLPFTIPHLALQIPEKDLEPYKGAFPEMPYDGKKGYQPHPTPRAAYAAMITRLDRTVGQIVDLIRELGLDDDTIFVFTSDNGAVYEGVGGSDPVFFRSNGLLRDYKGSVHEGGIRIPCIVRWDGHVPAGKTSDLVAGFQDFLPTFTEIAGGKTPEKVDGISLLPTLVGKGEQKTHPFLYWEFASYGGQRAVRMDRWKAVQEKMTKGNTKIELYDLIADPSETTDVAAANPAVIARIERIFAEQHVANPVFPLPGVDVPAKK